MTDATSDWFWEGNVVDAIARKLETDGWTIVNKADTHSRQQGVDLHAQRGSLNLLIEVKGYPSIGYRDPPRASEVKPTNPSNQAQHWFSHALLKVMRLQTKHPNAIVAMAFPDFLRYRALFAETKVGLEKLNAVFITVSETGRVEMHGMPDPQGRDGDQRPSASPAAGS